MAPYAVIDAYIELSACIPKVNNHAIGQVSGCFDCCFKQKIPHVCTCVGMFILKNKKLANFL
jgi:hypothetical protein